MEKNALSNLLFRFNHLGDYTFSVRDLERYPTTPKHQNDKSHQAVSSKNMNQDGRTQDPIVRFQGCIRLPDQINNAWTVQSHYCNQIRPLYSNKNNKSTEAAEPLPRTKNTEPQIKSVEINDKLPTKLVLKLNYHHVRGSRTSTECIKLINRHEFIRPESESAKMQNYESKRAFRCRYEYLDYSHIPHNTTDRNNSQGKPRLRR